MDAKELRIGNFVIHKPYGNKEGKPVKIAGMLGMQAYFDKHTNESAMFHYLVGIPFTPDILEKCGFEKQTYYYFTDWVHWLDNNGFSLKYTIHKESKMPNQFVIYGNGAYDDAGERDIHDTCQYIHQLQNLYFALTGEEIDIKGI